MIEKLGKYYNVISGFAFKSSDLKDSADIPIIKIGNISNGKNVIIENMQYVDHEFLNINEKYHIKNGDVLISLTGSHINQPNSMVGRVCRNYDKQTYLLNQRAGKIIAKENASTDYMFYALLTKAMKESIVSRAYGAANQVNVSPSAIMGIKWNFPTLPTQQKIATILSAYDRLIENNTRRIRLLEQMAENLYKEWFSYRKIKGQSKAVKLKEIINITRGLSYSSEEIDCTDGNNLINLKNIQGYGGFRLDGTKLYKGKYKPEQIVEEGDLIMGVTDMTQDRRTVGSVALIPNVNTLSVISADLVKINSSIDNTYLYAMFRYGNVSRHIAQFANGANVLHLRPKSILNIKVFLPNQDIIDSFVSKVKPMIQLTNRLNTEIDSLTRQRDLLLPRLMSGKLEVKS